MKIIIPLLLSLFLLVVPAQAETRHITDEIPVMVRHEPGENRRIVAMPKSGTRVEVLDKTEGGWSRVRLPDGKEGWMLTHYLSKGPSNKELIAQLKSENEALSKKTKSLVEDNPRLKNERDELQKALSEQTRTAEALRQSYDTLKKGSSQYLALKASYEKASQELAERTQRQAELEEGVRNLRNTRTLQWFLAGAAVLFVGLTIGYLSRRPKRRPSLL